MKCAQGQHVENSDLSKVILLFLKLGFTAFGGPAAHTAMMQEEVVHKRRWLSKEEFLDLMAATNFIPGPNSTELAIHIGHKVAGWRGLIAAGICFILPAALIVSGLGWVYVTYGALPESQAVLHGAKPVIIAIVAQAIWALGKSALRSRFLFFLAAIAALANFLGGNELAVIALGGLAALLWERAPPQKSHAVWAPWVPWRALASTGAVAVPLASAFSLSKLFLFFLKVGSVLFGSGYVLLAFLRTDLVERWQWLTEAQLLDAVAVGQFTPGPVFTTATFIGYTLAGPSGAAVATLGIFLPAFVFVAITAPVIPKLRRSKSLGAVLDGVNTASLAVMAVSTLFLAKGAVTDFFTATVAVVALVLLLRFKMNSAWLVLVGGVLGIAWVNFGA